MVGLYDIGAESHTIRHGDRIAQARIADIRRCTTVEVDSLTGSARGSGGSGSTGAS